MELKEVELRFGVQFPNLFHEIYLSGMMEYLPILFRGLQSFLLFLVGNHLITTSISLLWVCLNCLILI